MIQTRVQEKFNAILPLVEQPSRYLGTEPNRVLKDPDKVRLRAVLAFPDLYEVGMSHFGIQILYHILNSHASISAERVFTPAADMIRQLKSRQIPLASLESRQPLADFDIIGFSLLHELNFTNILAMLDLSGIPFLSSERDASFPLIIAGGPCTCNPEPVADFFDAIVIGDGETVILEMMQAWLDFYPALSQRPRHRDKQKLLTAWSAISGVYIPGFFKPSPGIGSDDAPGQSVQPLYPEYIKVKRRIVNDLNPAPFPDMPIVPFARPVHDRLRLEISRGCTRGCRFCQAGMIYRPVRERSLDNLIRLTRRTLEATGYEDISLLSLSTGDYSCIGELLAMLMREISDNCISVSLPSVRADALTPEIMQLIKTVRKTGFTIAPEAGSQRLRDVINKNLTQEDIVRTVQDAYDMGWKLMKLYFMIGLPTETDADIDALTDLAVSLRRTGKKRLDIHVSIGIFVPKPHTPFQWAPQISCARAREVFDRIFKKLKMPGIKVKWQQPEVSILESVFARGGRQLSRVLISAWQNGCMFDGWREHFNFNGWQDAFLSNSMDLHQLAARSLEPDSSLPWDHIDTGIKKQFLLQEWRKALNEETTPDCRSSDCSGCGVCDFKEIRPVLCPPALSPAAPKPQTDFESGAKAGPESGPESRPGGRVNPAGGAVKKIMVTYSKTGDARYFGHLEMVSHFQRAIRRAGIPITYSEGFHPMPKMAFGNPLPLGMESLCEHFIMSVTGSVHPAHVTPALNAQLPAGLAVSECKPASKLPETSLEQYRIELTTQAVFKETELNRFTESREWMITRTSRKGKTRQMDLKTAVTDIRQVTPQRLLMNISREAGQLIRPLAVMKQIFSIEEDDLKTADILKTGGREFHV